MLIDYPNKSDIEKFNQRKAKGLIPQNAKIGGGIGIHGTWPRDEIAVENFQNWTNGCVSLKRDEMNELYNMIPIGTKVTITGVNFTSKNNTINFTKGSTRSSYQGYDSKDNKTIQFTIPTYHIPLCAYSTFAVSCIYAKIDVNLGAYKISVVNAYGTSNEIKFIVSPK